MLGNTQNGDLRHRACYEQIDSNRRCNKADSKVYYHNDAEMNRIDTKSCHDRKENRCQNQNGRSGIHDHADKEQEQIDNKKDDNLGAEVINNKFSYKLRSLTNNA